MSRPVNKSILTIPSIHFDSNSTSLNTSSPIKLNLMVCLSVFGFFCYSNYYRNICDVDSVDIVSLWICLKSFVGFKNVLKQDGLVGELQRRFVWHSWSKFSDHGYDFVTNYAPALPSFTIWLSKSSHLRTGIFCLMIPETYTSLSRVTWRKLGNRPRLVLTISITTFNHVYCYALLLPRHYSYA